MPPVYATVTDFEAYVEGWSTDNEAALERMLERAEKDLDAHAFTVLPRRAGLRKLDPAALEPEQAEALRDATCAQAHYRFEMGEEHFYRAQRQRVARRGVTLEGTLPIVGPEAMRELASGSLTALTTTLGGGRPDPDELWRQA